jgi:tetratricopeptide (TPR) repeat protein
MSSLRPPPSARSHPGAGSRDLTASLGPVASLSALGPSPGDQELQAWLQEHLPAICPSPLLGVLGAGIEVELWRSAPAHWPHIDRAARLVQAASEVGRLRALAQVLLLDEATAEAAVERGLPALLGAPTDDTPVQRVVLHQPPITLPAIVPRPEAMAALDGPWHAQARVIALGGRLGAGKSVLLAEWLAERGLLHDEQLGAAGLAGLFYWSFTQDPDVPSCLQAAAALVEALAPPPAEGSRRHLPPELPAGSDEAVSQRAVEILIDALGRVPAPVVLVFDGLERLQLEGEPAPDPKPAPETAPASALATLSPLLDDRAALPEGEIRDPQLRCLLRSLVLPASGAVVLCTTERPIPSLQPFWRSGYAHLELPPLSVGEGAELLRIAGAPSGGEPDACSRCLETEGHALTLDLLGRYVSAYYQGDVRAVPLHDLPGEGAALERVLRAQFQALSPSHRQLLDLCALLPGPLREAPIAAALRAGSVAPAQPVPAAGQYVSQKQLADMMPPAEWLQPSLRARLDELCRLGLVRWLPAPDGPDEEERLDMHPAVRALILHEWCAAHGGAAPRLDTDGAEQSDGPGGDVGLVPTGDAALDLVEQLTFALVRAGHAEVAFALLCHRLGGFQHLVLHLGRPRRLLAVLRHLYPALAAPALGSPRWRRRYALLLLWETESLRLLGQLEAALVTAQRQWPLGTGPLPGSLLRQARLHRMSGRLQLAEELLTVAQQRASTVSERAQAAIEMAALMLWRGDAAISLVHLRDAESILREQPGLSRQRLDGISLGAWLLRVHARRALRLGDVTAARALLERSRAASERERSEVDLAQCDVLLGEALRRDGEYDAAAQALHRALQFAGRSGDAEVLITAGMAQARLRIDTNSYEGAAAALGTAMALASEAGLHCHRVDLLVLRGHLSLRRHDLLAAEQDARDALALACLPGCGYAWGEADALHLLATTLLASRPVHKSPRHGEAVAHLTDELNLRERMFDPTAPEVRWLLRRLRA